MAETSPSKMRSEVKVEAEEVSQKVEKTTNQRAQDVKQAAVEQVKRWAELVNRKAEEEEDDDSVDDEMLLSPKESSRYGNRMTNLGTEAVVKAKSKAEEEEEEEVEEERERNSNIGEKRGNHGAEGQEV